MWNEVILSFLTLYFKVLSEPDTTEAPPKPSLTYYAIGSYNGNDTGKLNGFFDARHYDKYNFEITILPRDIIKHRWLL